MPVMTTKDSFPVTDITHKPKRTQAANLASVQVSQVATVHEESQPKYPTIVTLERAIEFYESNANGDNAVLFTQTARWLRDYMTKTSTTTAGATIDGAQELINAIRRGRGDTV